jgi:hypothetical protein
MIIIPIGGQTTDIIHASQIIISRKKDFILGKSFYAELLKQRGYEITSS